MAVGVGPHEVGRWSLYEFNASMKHYARLKSGKPDMMTPEDFEAGKEAIRKMNLPDVRI